MELMRKVEILRAACCVAGIDGETSERERQILQKLADEVGVGEASLNAMIDRAETDKEFYKEQFRVLKADPKETVEMLFVVALSDRRLSRDECEVLERLASQLDVSQEQFEEWFAQVKKFVADKKKD